MLRKLQKRRVKLLKKIDVLMVAKIFGFSNVASLMQIGGVFYLSKLKFAAYLLKGKNLLYLPNQNSQL